MVLACSFLFWCHLCWFWYQDTGSLVEHKGGQLSKCGLHWPPSSANSPPVKYSFSYLSLAFLTPFLSGTLAPNPNTPFCCKTIGWCDFRTHSHCIFSPPSSPPTIYVFGTLSVRRTKAFLAPPKTELALFVKALFFKFCFVLFCLRKKEWFSRQYQLEFIKKNNI